MRRRGLPTLGLVPALPPHPQAGLSQLLALPGSAGGRRALAAWIKTGAPPRWRGARRRRRPCAFLAWRCGSGLVTRCDGMVGPDGVHWQLATLSLHDGSIFPTSTGAGPQLSTDTAVDRLAQGLATRLAGREVALA